MNFFLSKSVKRSIVMGHSAFFLIFFSFSMPLYSEAQISQHLLMALPDSVRPQDRSHLSISEVQKILRYTFDFKDWGRKEYDETDSLCVLFAPKYISLPNIQERKAFLFLVCRYFYSGTNYHTGKTSLRGAGKIYEYPYAKLAIKYCNLYIDLYKNNEEKNIAKLATLLLFKSFFYMEEDRYTDAHTTLQSGLIAAKQSSDPLVIISTYNSLASLFERLDLPAQSLVYCDSARLARKNVPDSPRSLSMAANTISLSEIANFSLYSKTFKPEYANNLTSLHHIAKLTPDATYRGRLLAYSNVLLSGVAYYQGNYKNTLAYNDSACIAFPNLRLIDGWEMAMVFKALSLKKLGRISESDRILAQLDLNDARRPVIKLVLEDLYKREVNRGNYQKALMYHEQMLRFQQRKHILDMQGKSLEMEQYYNVRQRDEKISQLIELQKRNKIIVIVTFFVVLLIVAILIIRYRATLAKTTRLINQLDEATQLQILQLEIAREEERKILGQDLHDGLSSAIAGIRHHLELMLINNPDESIKDKLENIYKEVAVAYDTARLKSHTWFGRATDLREQTFEIQIRALADSSFPNSHYVKEIVVDEGALRNASTEARINILRIIQETFTNIVKHAKAKKVSVLIYEDMHEVILSVKDDGRGFNPGKIKAAKSSLGLLSMQERVQSMNGNLEIKSDAGGTEITVSLPI